MTTVYLDWNVFNKLEHLSTLEEAENLVYNKIDKLIFDETIICPFSNAHINDLYRGYLKDPSYAEGHLLNIERITRNLCITQYWGEPKVKWHFRHPKEYLESTVEETDYSSASFSTLFSSLNDPLMTATFGLQKTLMEFQPVDPKFRQIYTVNPIFNILFPRTKTAMNMLSLCEDLFDFSFKIKTDYTLYKHFRKFLNELKIKFPAYQSLYSNMQTSVIGKPKYLTWDEMWDNANETHAKQQKTDYDKIVNLFTTTDLKGYRQDERFANMIDDALHCFYSAHCNYFITLDKRCFDKAKKVFETLKIQTVVCTPEEFIAGFI